LNNWRVLDSNSSEQSLRKHMTSDKSHRNLVCPAWRKGDLKKCKNNPERCQRPPGEKGNKTVLCE